MRFITGGESHGKCLTAIIEGLPAGLIIDEGKINHDLLRRQGGYGRGGRMVIETDRVEVVGGEVAGKTIGAPLVLRIVNKDWDNWKEKWQKGNLEKLTIPRPGHADYAGMLKYHINDARLVLERASARETAARVAVGAVAKQLLSVWDVQIGSVVNEIGRVAAQIADVDWKDIFIAADKSLLRTSDETAEREMMAIIDQAREEGDTLGGVFTVVALGVPIGLGSHVHWERRLEAKLAMALMSIQAIKGIEVGDAFENAKKYGSQVHDDMYPNGKGGVYRKTNNAGGIEGGMSNGEPIIVRAAMKPIATTIKPHDSVNMIDGSAATYMYQRSDYCAVPAAAVVGEAMVAWVLADAALEKWGGDSIEEITQRWKNEKISY